jgi:hypothetical protein
MKSTPKFSFWLIVEDIFKVKSKVWAHHGFHYPPLLGFHPDHFCQTGPMHAHQDLSPGKLMDLIWEEGCVGQLNDLGSLRVRDIGGYRSET